VQQWLIRRSRYVDLQCVHKKKQSQLGLLYSVIKPAAKRYYLWHSDLRNIFWSGYAFVFHLTCEMPVISWTLLRSVRLGIGRPSVVCLSSVMFMRPTQRVKLLGNTFAASNSLGAWQFVLKFWTESRRGSRWSCKLNVRRYVKLRPISDFIS